MTPKKTKKASLESKRGLFFQFGLIVALLALFGVFEIGTTQKKQDDFTEVIGVDVDVEMLSPMQKEKPKPPKPKPIKSLELNIVSDNEIIDGDQQIDFWDFEELPDFEDVEIVWDEETEFFLSDEIIGVAEKMPEFPGGQKALLEYLSKNTEYPAQAQEALIEGTVYVRFVISKTGKISQAQIVRGVHKLIDNEALKVVENMPDWKPGMQRGRTVSVWYTIPVVFKLY